MIRNKISETEVIHADYQQALHCLYSVWMLAPNGDSALLVEYEMDQEAIEEFFEEYTRFAEMLVRIEVKEGTPGGSTASIEDNG